MPTGKSATLRRSLLTDAGDSIPGSRLEVGSVGLDYDRSFAAGSTNVALATSFVVANIQSIFLVATADLTIKTNSTSSPADTINLKAGSALDWSKSDGYYSCPFGTNVTSFYITCSAAARLRGQILTA